MASGNAPLFLNGTQQRLDPPQIDDVTKGIIVKAIMALGLVAVVAKTASYTIGTVATDTTGTLFTNEGAGGAVVFTLPSPVAGTVYFFAGVADQNITISAGAGLGVTVNNAAAASIAYSTASQKIGSFAVAIAIGTKWLLVNIGTNTATVA